LTDISPALIERIRAARAYVIDMDGTIALGDSRSGGHKELPGAIAFLASLRSKGVPFRIFTNGTAKPPAAYAAGLRHAGFDIADGEMMTPSTAAAHWFVRHKIRKVRVLGSSGVALPLQEAGIEVIGSSEKSDGVQAVFTGWFPDFKLHDLEAACRDVWGGAMLTSASNVPFFASTEGRAIGISFAINSMIRSLTARRPIVLGKPSSSSFYVALAMMGLPRSAAAHVVVLGDDPALEMRMAHNAGAIALGMTTGIMKPETIHTLPAKSRPDHLFDDLGSLSKIIGR
jgi:HAD superfamily hydrolase (TIGR01450 family)